MQILKKYFLASNSCEGFVSAFRDNYDKLDGWRAYIIKGGPGTGKSSFMKKLAKAAENRGVDTVYCYCSSDPDSLDGVIFKDKKVIVLDGTPPHAIEPELPGMCENIINLGQCWNSEKLYSNREKIIEATLKNKLIHRTASSYLLAAGKIFSDNLSLSSSFVNTKKVSSFAHLLCRKYIHPKKNGEPLESIRFITGITPKGIVNFTDEINHDYKNKVIISDTYFSVAPIIMETVRSFAKICGYEIISIKNSFMPSAIFDHILIPELSLAFLTENSFLKFESDTRRIHARRFIDMAAMSKHREKRRFNKRLFSELIDEAIFVLKKAKSSHDVLEEYYINSMDFDKLNVMLKDVEREIFGA